jgi:5-methylcytosine-specific restriction endonuclease McrA
VVLGDATLVLNRNWVPVDVTTVLKALVKVYEGGARAICPADFTVHDFASWASLSVPPEGPCVRTATLEIPVPEVILLARYGKVPGRHLVFSRRNLFRRDRYTCQYCGAQPGRDELTIDHVVPRSRGGVSSWTNCVLACLGCNTAKGDRKLAECGLALRNEPKKPTRSPKMVLGTVRRRASWGRFMSDAYWDVELEA